MRPSEASEDVGAARVVGNDELERSAEVLDRPRRLGPHAVVGGREQGGHEGGLDGGGLDRRGVRRRGELPGVRQVSDNLLSVGPEMAGQPRGDPCGCGAMAGESSRPGEGSVRNIAHEGVDERVLVLVVAPGGDDRPDHLAAREVHEEAADCHPIPSQTATRASEENGVR